MHTIFVYAANRCFRTCHPLYLFVIIVKYLTFEFTDKLYFSDRPGRNGPPLTWAQRLKIAVDVARGLNYLHFDRAVPHGNLKATNVLLDTPDMNARVADYCLHRLMTQAGTIEQILDAGVLGYRAPELAASKKPMPSFKSDVYAFGVILLELLTGRCG
jgi:serine/threonine protein kinase